MTASVPRHQTSLTAYFPTLSTIDDAAREVVLAKSPRSNLGSCCVGIISGTTELARRVSFSVSANHRPVGLI